MTTLATHGIQRILPRHFAIIDLAVAGHDNKAIAETLGCSTSQVGLILRSPVAQMEIARRRKSSTETEILGLDRSAVMGKARSILEQATESAATTLENELLNDKPEVRLKAANSILDRAFGNGADSRRGVVMNISSENIALINLALKESEYVPRKLTAHEAPADSSNERSSEVYGVGTGGALDVGGRVDEVSADSPAFEPGDVPEETSSGADDERSGGVR